MVVLKRICLRVFIFLSQYNEVLDRALKSGQHNGPVDARTRNLHKALKK